MSLSPATALAIDISLRGGAFHGPGDKGVHPFLDGSLNNIVLTGPFSGIVPFFNNGPEPPNVLAETLVNGPIDGRLSDGTLINENVNGAFALDIRDPKTGEAAVMLVASVSEENISADAKGNFTFDLHVKFDPAPFPVVGSNAQFTTGAVRIPLSLKTQMGLPGGHDLAGPYPSGRVFIGRLGDFDHDGFLDGLFVLSGNVPLELVIGRGDPILLIRGFLAPIPVSSLDASLLTLNGVIQNFPEPVVETIQAGQIEVALGYLADIHERLGASARHVRRILQNNGLGKDKTRLTTFAKKYVRLADRHFEKASSELTDGEITAGVENFRQGMGFTGAALQLLVATTF